MKAKKRRIAWYQLFVNRRIDKLELALAMLEAAEHHRFNNRPFFARLYLSKAKSLI